MDEKTPSPIPMVPKDVPIEKKAHVPWLVVNKPTQTTPPQTDGGGSGQTTPPATQPSSQGGSDKK